MVAALRRHFESKTHLRNLYYLYNGSEQECTRNGKKTPEIGTSREKDLIASLASNDDLMVSYDIYNKEPYDVIVNNRYISLKHSSNVRATSAGIKIVWSAEKATQDKFEQNFSFKCDLLIVYVREFEIEIIYITKEKLEELRQNSSKILKRLNGNSRGIEFDPTFFKKIIKDADIHLSQKMTHQYPKLDSISKRLALIKLLPDEQ